MIRAMKVLQNGRVCLIFGLTAENVRGLQAGRVLVASGEPLADCPVDVAIVHGETNVEVLRVLRRHGLPIEDEHLARAAAAGAGEDIVLVPDLGDLPS